MGYKTPEGQFNKTHIEANTPDEAVEALKSKVGEQLAEYWFEEKAILKFNNGALALLCSECFRIVRLGNTFSKEEMDYAKGKIKYLAPVYCDQHLPVEK